MANCLEPSDLPLGNGASIEKVAAFSAIFIEALPVAGIYLNPRERQLQHRSS